MDLLDARGLSCPQPVIMIRKAIKSGEKAYQILVDNTTAKENVSRFAKSQGFEVLATEKGEDFLLDIKKK